MRRIIRAIKWRYVAIYYISMYIIHGMHPEKFYIGNRYYTISRRQIIKYFWNFWKYIGNKDLL